MEMQQLHIYGISIGINMTQPTTLMCLSSTWFLCCAVYSTLDAGLVETKSSAAPGDPSSTCWVLAYLSRSIQMV